MLPLSLAAWFPDDIEWLDTVVLSIFGLICTAPITLLQLLEFQQTEGGNIGAARVTLGGHFPKSVPGEGSTTEETMPHILWMGWKRVVNPTWRVHFTPEIGSPGAGRRRPVRTVV